MDKDEKVGYPKLSRILNMVIDCSEYVESQPGCRISMDTWIRGKSVCPAGAVMVCKLGYKDDVDILDNEPLDDETLSVLQSIYHMVVGDYEDAAHNAKMYLEFSLTDEQKEVLEKASYTVRSIYSGSKLPNWDVYRSIAKELESVGL